jgi:hypothetical protein
MTQFSSPFWASNQPCCLLQCSGTTLWVRLRHPLVFLIVLTCWETRFSSRRYSTYFLFPFLDHHTSHPARHDARILLYECIFDAFWIFSSSFRSIGSLLSIGRHSTSLHSARLQTGRLLSWFVIFSFEPMCMLFDLSIALWSHHDLSKVATPTPRSGACETWVPLGPHQPGSQPPLTSGFGLPEDPPTCQWTQPT